MLIFFMKVYNLNEIIIGKATYMKRILSIVLVCILVITFAACGNSDCAHELTDIAEKAATCTEDGNVACQQCTLCSAYFDAEGNELRKKEVVTEATGHKWDIALGKDPNKLVYKVGEAFETAGMMINRVCAYCATVEEVTDYKILNKSAPSLRLDTDTITIKAEGKRLEIDITVSADGKGEAPKNTTMGKPTTFKPTRTIPIKKGPVTTTNKGATTITTTTAKRGETTVNTTTTTVAPTTTTKPAKIIRKISCVGDSLTWGHEWNTQSYPRKLAAELGFAYTVTNFGANGRNVAGYGGNGWPYANNDPTYGVKYQNSLSTQADAIIIMLGTNDVMSSVGVVCNQIVRLQDIPVPKRRSKENTRNW